MTNIETGRVKLTSDLAIQIEKVHSINMRWLLTGEGDMFGGDTTGNQSNVVVFENQVIIPVYRNITACGGIGTDNSYIDEELERQLPLPVDAIKFYYPKNDGSGVTLRSAEGSGVPSVSFDRKDMQRNNQCICGVVVSVVGVTKPQWGR